jgi:hypothetical protein
MFPRPISYWSLATFYFTQNPGCPDAAGVQYGTMTIPSRAGMSPSHPNPRAPVQERLATIAVEQTTCGRRLNHCLRGDAGAAAVASRASRKSRPPRRPASLPEYRKPTGIFVAAATLDPPSSAPALVWLRSQVRRPCLVQGHIEDGSETPGNVRGWGPFPISDFFFVRRLL